jgi:hypothetical protein
LAAKDWQRAFGSGRRLVWRHEPKFTCDEDGLHVAMPENLDAKTALTLKIQ